MELEGPDEHNAALAIAPIDVVLSITWHPASLGGRSGVIRVSHLDGHDDHRQMDRRDAEALAILHLGMVRVERQLQGQGVEWTKSPN
jgi:hypothetical protein